MYSWEKHMPSMWTALVNVIRNVLRHAGSQLPCWVYHVLDFVLVFVCLCVCVARAICAMCLTLFLCVLRSVFGLVRLYPLVATYLSPKLHWFWLTLIPFQKCGFWSVWFWVLCVHQYVPKGRPAFKEVLPLLPGPRRQFCRLNVLLIVRYDIKTFFCQ